MSFTFEALFVTYFYICISHLKLCLCVLFGMAAMLWLYCLDNCHKPLVILIQNNQQHQHKHCDLKIVLKDWFINQPILSKRLNPLIYWGSRFTVHEGQNASDTKNGTLPNWWEILTLCTLKLLVNNNVNWHSYWYYRVHK